jgi:A/G-specific adenine glycosylase
VAHATGRVEELPGSRPRRPTPVRSAHLLLVLQRDRVLLEQRPGAGIWGGLLAPPQFDGVRQLAAALRTLAPDARARAMPPRRHAFTHFTLRFTPHVARLDRLPAIARQPHLQWLPRREIERAALPTPIRALLQEVMATARARPH